MRFRPVAAGYRKAKRVAAGPAAAYNLQGGLLRSSRGGEEVSAMGALPRDDLLRADNREAISEAMNAWLANRTMAEAITELEKARIPAGPVLDLGQVLEDPQVKARELLRYVEYPGAPKPVPLADTAVRLSTTPGSIRHRAPTLGEHTDEVLKEIGYSDQEIAALQKNEVV